MRARAQATVFAHSDTLIETGDKSSQAEDSQNWEDVHRQPFWHVTIRRKHLHSYPNDVTVPAAAETSRILYQCVFHVTLGAPDEQLDA